jgi:hypothetical protein
MTGFYYYVQLPTNSIKTNTADVVHQLHHVPLLSIPLPLCCEEGVHLTYVYMWVRASERACVCVCVQSALSDSSY